MTRNLNILYIDDKAGRLDFVDGFCAVKSVGSLEEVQRLLLERQSGRPSAVDLLLCDIDMSLNHVSDGNNQSRKDVLWPAIPESSLRPYGPLLALPFIGTTPWCQFIPYSTFWKDPAVYQNGYVLTAVSLIVSANTLRVVPIEDVFSNLQAVAEDHPPSGTPAATRKASRPSHDLRHFVDPRPAITHGLSNIRAWIDQQAASVSIQLVGVDLALEQLRGWVDVNTTSDWQQVSLPFSLGGAPIAIGLVHPFFGLDYITISSLCADLLNLRKPRNREAITPVFEVLERWEKIPGMISQGDEATYRKALGILGTELPGDNPKPTKAVRRHRGKNQPSGKANQATSHQFVGPKIRIKNITRDDSEYAAVARTVILLAFTRAWYFRKCYSDEKYYEDTRSVALEYLGIDSGDMNKLVDLLCPNRKTVGTGPLRAPLKRNYTSIYDAYLLTEDWPALLTPFDMYCCRKFVIDGDVHPSKEPAGERKRWEDPEFPRWITLRDD